MLGKDKANRFFCVFIVYTDLVIHRLYKNICHFEAINN